MGELKKSWSLTEEGDYEWDPEGDVQIGELDTGDSFGRVRFRPTLSFLVYAFFTALLLLFLALAWDSYTILDPHKDCVDDWAASTWDQCGDPCANDGTGRAFLRPLKPPAKKSSGAGLLCRDNISVECEVAQKINFQPPFGASLHRNTCLRSRLPRKCHRWPPKVLSDDPSWPAFLNDTPIGDEAFIIRTVDLSALTATQLFFVAEEDQVGLFAVERFPGDAAGWKACHELGSYTPANLHAHGRPLCDRAEGFACGDEIDKTPLATEKP